MGQLNPDNTPRGGQPLGRLVRRIADLEVAVKFLRSAQGVLNKAEIRRGGLRVTGGGNVDIEDGGGVFIRDGGSLRAEHPGGTPGAQFGPETTSNGSAAHALTLRNAEGNVVFAATVIYPNDIYPDGSVTTQLGTATYAVPYAYTHADQEIHDVEEFYRVAHANGSVVTLGSAGAYISGGSLGVGIDPLLTAEAPNMVLDLLGKVRRSTSSRRYKTDVTAADIDVEQVLALQPRRFRTKAQVEELGDDAPTYVGFIAEEAADLGLDDWVTSDDEGPEAFSYATWAVALHGVVQRQQTQIDELQQQLESLKEAR